MDLPGLAEGLLAEAARRGFAAAGITGVEPFTAARARGLQAIEEGRMEGMPWYTPERVVAATDLGRRYPWARSILSLAWPYAPARSLSGSSVDAAAVPGRPRGRVASYALLGAHNPVDYHDLLDGECRALTTWLAERVPDLRSKRFVDHGWAMDRAVAERAGVGFAGKNACLLTLEAGSYVLLAEMLLSVELPAASPSARGCGSCARCLPACPTAAIVAPGMIDAPRCISYLTIEHRGPIDEALRPLIGTWIFGCDLCQEACPVNRRRAPAALPVGSASTAHGPVPFPDLVECLELDDTGFAGRFRGTAVWRTGRAGLARNAAIALGNAGDAAAVPALRRAMRDDADPVVRDAAGWAAGRLLRPPAATA